MSTLKAYVFLADGFEEIEAVTPIDILRRANIDTSIISISDNKLVVGAHGISIEADCIFSEARFEDADALILPGGLPGTTNLSNHKELEQVILAHHTSKKLIAAICAAPSILGNLGMLDGKEAICYPSFEHQLKGAEVSRNKNVVKSGNIITAKAAGSSIAFALEIVRSLQNDELSSKIGEAIFI